MGFTLINESNFPKSQRHSFETYVTRDRDNDRRFSSGAISRYSDVWLFYLWTFWVSVYICVSRISEIKRHYDTALSGNRLIIDVTLTELLQTGLSVFTVIVRLSSFNRGQIQSTILVQRNRYKKNSGIYGKVMYWQFKFAYKIYYILYRFCYLF